MSRWRLIRESLTHYGRYHVAVALGVVAATAVLTGALVVGDSVRGSLRSMALDRLGRIDHALVSSRFFRAQLADELSRHDGFAQSFEAAVPIVLVSATVERAATAPEGHGVATTRSGNVTLIGCDKRFWSVGRGGPPQQPAGDQIVLNQTLADDLSVAAGDEVLLRVGFQSDIPPDTPLGRKTETVRSRRLRVSHIVPSRGLGRFGLRPNQQLPHNAFVALATLQDMLEKPGRANVLLVSRRPQSDESPPRSSARIENNRGGSSPVRRGHNASDGARTGDLNAWLRPRLTDLGLDLRRLGPGHWQLTSQRLLLDPAVVEAAQRAFTAAGLETRRVFTYLANRIASADREIPYSTITAADFDRPPPFGPLYTPDGQPIGPLADDEIVLNQWAAEALQVKPGATIEIDYFQPETTHGVVAESTVRLRLKAIAAIRPPAVGRHLTPEMRGITDRLTMADWDPPFPFDSRRITDRDENYWDQYGTTPKAFISLRRGIELWRSRFGQTTSLEIALRPDHPPGQPEPSLEELQARLRETIDPASLGMAFRPVRRLALRASRGTTAFEGLFLGFSFFVIASAVLLIVLLFRLSIDRRASQIGMLAAVGWPKRRITRTLVAEGTIVALAGAAVGVAVGMGYGWLMLVGLQTWWLDAIRTPFLQLFVSLRSLTIGYTAGLVVSTLTMLWSLRQLRRLAPRDLLAGQTTAPESVSAGRRSPARAVGWSLIGLALIVALAAPMLEGDAQTGAFFGSGALILIGMLLVVWCQLRQAALGTVIVRGRRRLIGLAMRNAARNPTRSGLTLALVAAATFLIVAISAFRLEPPRDTRRRDTGSGGFSLLARAAAPIYHDLNKPAAREELGFSEQESQQIDQATIFAFRLRPGDDASCLNLYHPQQPTVLGVPHQLIERGGFQWAAVAPGENNPWRLLERPLATAAEAQPHHDNAAAANRSQASPHPPGKPKPSASTTDTRETNLSQAAPRSTASPASNRRSSPVVPVVLDQNTAMFSLHLTGGVGSRYTMSDGSGRQLTFEVVGLLKNSIFQGQLLIAQSWFERLFPEVNGYRYFLIDVPPEQQTQVAQTLESALGDLGLDVQTTASLLQNFFAVQNTYLSTFQSLGGLGLLLGTFGLATVQLRNVFERRGELALLRAVGFQPRRLAWLVILENTCLLLGGLAIGSAAALVAVGPHWWTGRATLPVASLTGTLGLVVAVGTAAGFLAVRAMLQAPLVAALRGD